MAREEVIRWKSSDGTEIEGILEKPADFDPHKRYPLLVVIHGGPVAVDQLVLRPDRTYPLEQFVAEGALVLRPNYRGSAGYGSKIARARSTQSRNGRCGRRDIGSRFPDRERVRRSLARRRHGLERRRLRFGVSRHVTDRFSAVSVGAGISDWITVLREHRHHALHPAVSEGHAVGRSGGVPAELRRLPTSTRRKDADADPARRRRQARSDPECL